MSRYIEVEHDHDDVDRRGLLKCMAWAGKGVVFTLTGCGVATQRLGDKAAAKATGSFTFV
jgi:Icc protein